MKTDALTEELASRSCAMQARTTTTTTTTMMMMWIMMSDADSDVWACQAKHETESVEVQASMKLLEARRRGQEA
eukprot:1700925-Rhodomonas_salina.1